MVVHLLKKIKSLSDLKFIRTQEIAVTLYKIKGNGCTTNDEVGNRVPDTPVKFQPIAHRIGRRRAFFV